jgi:hypothetical protein
VTYKKLIPGLFLSQGNLTIEFSEGILIISVWCFRLRVCYAVVAVVRRTCLFIVVATNGLGLVLNRGGGIGLVWFGLIFHLVWLVMVNWWIGLHAQ